MNAIIYACLTASQLVGGVSADFIIQKNYFTKTTVRKLIQSSGKFATRIGLPEPILQMVENLLQSDHKKVSSRLAIIEKSYRQQQHNVLFFIGMMLTAICL